MRISRILIVVAMIALISFRLFVVPTIQIKHEDKFFAEFVDETDLHLEELGGITDIEEIVEYIESIVIGEVGYAYLLDESGNIMHHPNTDIIGMNINDFDIPEITTSIDSLNFTGEERTIEYEFEGITKIARFYRDQDSRIIAFTDTYDKPSILQLVMN